MINKMKFKIAETLDPKINHTQFRFVVEECNIPFYLVKDLLVWGLPWHTLYGIIFLEENPLKALKDKLKELKNFKQLQGL